MGQKYATDCYIGLWTNSLVVMILCFSDSIMKHIPKDVHPATSERKFLPDEWEIYAS
jgi:hypothetical protein